MALKALILRADGVLVEIDELRRAALNRAIADAGFSWQCDRAAFAAVSQYRSAIECMVSFVMPRLGYQRASVDAAHLAAAMARRQASILSELLQSTVLATRAGVRDLIVAAKAEGLQLALISAVSSIDTFRICELALGEGRALCFDVIETPQPLNNRAQASDDQTENEYAAALRKLGLPAAACLAIDCRPQGLLAATAAGLRTVVIRSSAAADDEFEPAVFVADGIPALIGITGNSRLDPFTAQQRSELILALQRFHAGLSGPEGGSEGLSVMKVTSILQAKGPSVKTIQATASVRELSQRLSSDAVGAMVVVSADGRLAGIISERDVARGLVTHGAALPGLPIAELMTKSVVTCAPGDTIASVSKIMTQRRIRHLPVIEGGELVGIVSIGDVLKYRLDEAQLEATVLRDYALAKR